MTNELRKYFFILSFIFPLFTPAQTSIEPFVGYSIDVVNKESFSQANIGLQYAVLKKRAYQMLIGAQAGLPVSKHQGEDVAYTFDPALALSSVVPYKSKFYSYSFYLRHRFRIISWADKNAISLFVNAGLVYQHIAVSHSGYDKEKYSILNPHRDLKKFGLNFGGGIQYKRKLRRGEIFLQTEAFSSPLVKSVNNYHYKLPVPLALNIGYIIDLKNREK